MKDRRSAIKTILAGAASLTTMSMAQNTLAGSNLKLAKLKGNINHSVCRWCFNNLSLDELCKVANEIGLKAIDLVGPKDWNILKKYNLDSSMCNGAEISLTEGWNTISYHETLIRNYSEMIPLVAKAGYKNLICFSGNRRGMDDETGLKNCITGLKKILSLAEKHGVVLVMELLNSKVDHKDYQCDHTAWGAELAKVLASENFKLLFDIYHMQVNEGNVIQNIRDYHQYIAHYHTAGVPGRHEIDDTQELYYPAIIRAIKDTGFNGYIAQEFIPAHKDNMESLRKAIQICDI
ncbi:hydroxypyruvate isomerase family protein [Arcticibacter sp.]|jgi:hydroxypyruvate isomerase|uniref:hydroxypyruvate isomerase family protein n=1 Tax=Arcticibacter sp. TaxID=1872630 RepID=UPI0038903D71